MSAGSPLRRRLLPALLVLAVACATNPVTGERELALVSEAQEIEMGREADEQIVRQLGLYDDAELAGLVERLGERMAAASERPQLPWTFRVVDDPTVNAFALPGGFIYMTRGILTYANSEAEVAGILGHEIGHVTARHSVQRMSSAMLAQIGLGLGTVLAPEVAAFGDILQTGLGLLFLKFGRDDERQADELGVRYAAAAGYDPRPMADMFRTFDRLSEEQGGRLPTWLSTHPDPGDRVQAILAAAEPRVAGRDDLIVGRTQYLQRLDGVVFGANPREGVVIEGTFVHPDLLFQLEFPDGWSITNTKQAVQALQPDERAAMLLTAESARQGESLRQYAQRVVEARDASGARGAERRINGLSAFEASYRVSARGVGTLRVGEVFIAYGDLVYDLVGYATAGQYDRYRRSIESAQASFRPLPQGEASRIQPNRIELLRPPSGVELAAFVGDRPAAVGIDRIALINGMYPGDRLRGGTPIKWVRPGY